MTMTPLPRILLVEDDPVSRAFLAAAVAALPAQVETADSLAAATALATTRRYDLWLFDANLPDGRGEELLQRLRRTQPDVPAIAHTADAAAGSTQALIAAGFATALVKPLPASAVLAAVRALLPAPAPAAVWADWDDEAANRALNGRHEHVAALRNLFLGELPLVLERIAAAVERDDRDGLRAEAHRLRASCGFVGAVRLQSALQVLDAAPQCPTAWRAFAAAARALTGEREPEAATE